MTTKTSRMAKRGTRAAKRLYKKVETKVMAIEGRRSVRAKGRKLGRVGRQVAETGLLIGAVVALEMVLDRLTREHGKG
jgi:hypothetical protein